MLEEPKKFIAPGRVDHRGLRQDQRRSNQWEALLHRGKGFIETDIMLTKDGQIVNMHPMDYPWSFEEIEAMSLEELEAAVQDHDRAKGRRVSSLPLMRDFIHHGIDRGLGYHFDIKGSDVDAQIRVARAAIQEIHRMREEGGFTLQPAMKKDAEAFVAGYAEHSMSIHALNLNTIRAAQEEARALNEKVQINLAYPSSPRGILKYGELIRPTYEWVMQRSGKTSVDELLSMPQEEWANYGIDLAKEIGAPMVFTDKDAVLNDVRKRTTEQGEEEYSPYIEYAKQHGIRVCTSIVYDVEEAERLIRLGVDKVMFEEKSSS